LSFETHKKPFFHIQTHYDATRFCRPESNATKQRTQQNTPKSKTQFQMRPVWKYSAEARRQQQQRRDGHSARDAVLTAAHQGKLCVCFSGASFGAAYQLGAAQILQELGLLDAHTPIAGAIWICVSDRLSAHFCPQQRSVREQQHETVQPASAVSQTACLHCC
jgi:hypothetical protein